MGFDQTCTDIIFFEKISDLTLVTLTLFSRTPVVIECLGMVSRGQVCTLSPEAVNGYDQTYTDALLGRGKVVI